MKILSDDVVQSFNSADAFNMRLKEVEANTVWIQRCLEDILVDKAAMNATEAQVHTNSQGTKLMLCPRGLTFGIDDFVPLRQCSMMSLFQRMDEGGQIIQRLDPQGVHDFVELGIKYAKEPKKIVKMPIVEGKINAFLSENYVDTLPSTLVYEEFQKTLNAIAGENVNEFKGEWSYPTSTAWFTLPKQKKVNGNVFDVVVGCTTSDAGYSGINFNAYLKDANVSCLPLMTTLSVVHRGQANYIKLQDTLSMLSSVIDKGINNLTGMMSVVIKNPINTMKRAAEKCNLPKRDILEILNNLKVIPTNAFDCYMTLARVINNAPSQMAASRLQGDVMKLLGIDWNKLDLPGDYAW